MMIAWSGMRAQTGRMRVIAENLANADSTGRTPGDMPYRRQIPTFKDQLDRANGVDLVQLGKPVKDRSEFRLRYDPSHPAADKSGYVKLPNVDPLVESMDMRESMRVYEANLNVIEASKSMISRMLDLLQRT
ncbi:MAG: flagellar basal body rod protein FlgC [Alphaproteobacteria bacterium]